MVDLTKFNEQEDVRPYVREPFKLGDYSYHTNGYICIRTELDDKHQELELTERNGKIVDRISKLFSARDFYSNEFIQLPELEDMTFEPCKHCNGVGKLDTCPECEGWCEVTARTEFNEYEVPCKTCDETGKVKSEQATENCDWCNGTGKITSNYNEPVSCCGQHMSLGLAHKIADLPDLKVGFEKGMYVFKFNGGEGVLMPLRV